VKNIKIVLGEIRWGGMDSIKLAEGKNLWRSLVDTGMNFLVP
jgi:hypothetical protein